MKITQTLLLAVTLSAGLLATTGANAATCPSSGCGTNWLNVPGDFSQPINNFSMYLLGGWFNVDSPDGNGGAISVVSKVLNTTGKQIQFTASQFDHVGPGQGTSILNANFNHYEIGSTANLFGAPVSIYLNGQATGTLIDNSDSTQGQWTLNTHLYADWNGNIGMDLGIMPLSTSASYSYVSGGFNDANGNWSPGTTVIAAGNIMDYHTGLAYMVGQGIMQNGPFQGIRVTVGLEGQDPLAAPVPLPAAAWLLGSSLLGLVGVARRKVA